MSQDYESIGQLSPAAETATTHQKGWDGIAGDVPTAEAPIDQLQSTDVSRWNNRANRQSLATTDDSSYAEDFFVPVNHPTDTPPLAGYGYGAGSYDQTPTAATDPSPFQHAPDGTIDGADAAADRSGNTGLQN